jgi:hypothetical protein
VERGSVQHGARLDDELAEGTDGLTTGAPVSARDRDDLDPEAPTPDEFDMAAVRPDLDALDAIAPGEFIARSELARWLLPSSFPGHAEALLEDARSAGAPDDVVVLLEQLDPAVQFEVFGEVWGALGGAVETRDEPHGAEHAQQDAPTDDAEALAAPLDDRTEELVAAVAEAVEQGIEGPLPTDSGPESPIVVEDGGPDLLTTAIGIALTPVRVAVAIVDQVAHVGSRLLHNR